MNCNKTNTTAANGPSGSRAATIQLDTIQHGRGKLTVSFSDNRHSWTLECKSRDVQTFAAFQRKVADVLGIWIAHGSQDHHRSRSRSDDWQWDVAAAFERGSAT